MSLIVVVVGPRCVPCGAINLMNVYLSLNKHGSKIIRFLTYNRTYFTEITQSDLSI